ncbi:MAG: PilW family protein [Pseudomonadales bacterium]|jgi:type IV pilus assembly protein PilW
MNKQLGLTLIEVLVTLALGAVLMTTVVSVYISGLGTNAQLRETSRLLEDSVFVSSQFAEEFEMAGYFGRLDDYMAATPAALPDVCNAAWVPTAATLAAQMAVPVTGYNDVASGFTCQGESVLEGTDVVVIARRSSQEVVTLDASTFYLQASPVNYVIDTGANATNFDLTEYASGLPLGLAPLLVNIYFVDATDLTLKRLTLSGSAFALEPLVENIDAFEIDYGVDRSNDGAPSDTNVGDDDAYVSTLATVADWQNVTAIQSYLLIRSGGAVSKQTDTRTYFMGEAGYFGPYSDQFKRRLVIGNVKLTNIGMRRQ